MQLLPELEADVFSRCKYGVGEKRKPVYSTGSDRIRCAITRGVNCHVVRALCLSSMDNDWSLHRQSPSASNRKEAAKWKIVPGRLTWNEAGTLAALCS